MISPGIQNSAPSGSSCIPSRMIPNAPSFISTPACNIETAVGAATCPSGDQVWNGHRPASTPHPVTDSGNTTFWKFGSNSCAYNSCRSNVPSPASWNTAKMPRKIRIEAATSMIVSFIAEYSFVRANVSNALLEPHTAISRYIGSTATSYQKKKKNRSSAANVPNTPDTSTQNRTKKSLL